MLDLKLLICKGSTRGSKRWRIRSRCWCALHWHSHGGVPGAPQAACARLPCTATIIAAPIGSRLRREAPRELLQLQAQLLQLLHHHDSQCKGHDVRQLHNRAGHDEEEARVVQEPLA